MKSFIRNIKKIEVFAFIFGFMVAIYILIFAPARYLTWHALPPPPEPAIEIFHATVDVITIKTESNKKFSCKIYNEKECWSEIHFEPLFGIPQWCFPEDYTSEHTKQMAKACNQRHNFGIIGTVYSLNDNGIIYVKHKGYIGIDGYWFGAMFGLFCAFIAFIGKQLCFRVVSLFK